MTDWADEAAYLRQRHRQALDNSIEVHLPRGVDPLDLGPPSKHKSKRKEQCPLLDGEVIVTPEMEAAHRKALEDIDRAEKQAQREQQDYEQQQQQRQRQHKDDDDGGSQCTTGSLSSSGATTATPPAPETPAATLAPVDEPAKASLYDTTDFDNFFGSSGEANVEDFVKKEMSPPDGTGDFATSQNGGFNIDDCDAWAAEASLEAGNVGDDASGTWTEDRFFENSLPGNPRDEWSNVTADVADCAEAALAATKEEKSATVTASSSRASSQIPESISTERGSGTPEKSAEAAPRTGVSYCL